MNRLISMFRMWAARKVFELEQSRYQMILDIYGCVAECPNCGEILTGTSEARHRVDSAKFDYICHKCGHVSEWDGFEYTSGMRADL